MRAYYRQKTPYQMQGVLTRPAVGLNAYTPSGALNDNYMSDLIDVSPYRDEAILFNKKQESPNKLMSVKGLNRGTVVNAYHTEHGTDIGDLQFIGMCVRADKWFLFFAHIPVVGIEVFTEFTMTLPSIPANGAYDKRFSKATFRTEAEIFYCFASESIASMHFIRIKYGETDTKYGYVDLPFYPKKIISHANRMFAIDTNNKIWWSRAGDLYSWYSAEFDDDRLLGSTSMGNKTYTLTGTIDTPRVFTATCTTVGTQDTRGILTIVGTNPLGNPLTATLDLPNGTAVRVQTPQVFGSITSVTQSGWTIAGTADTIVLGVGPTGGGFVVDDAGMWTIETERELNEAFVLSNVLYVSAGSSIYAFRGMNYSTFNLQKLFSNLGNPKESMLGYSNVVIGRNRAYFISGSDLCEFDGDNAPRVINKPVYMNNALTNGIMGGAGEFSDLWTLETDEDSLYVYSKYNGTTVLDPTIYYVFNYETRTWWKSNGWSKDLYSQCEELHVRFLPTYDNKDFIPLLWDHKESVEDSFWVHFGLSGQDGITIDGNYPYVVTKAFQSIPSEHGSLTTILLSLSGENETTADISVLYSLTQDSNDFKEITTKTDYKFNGDMEIIQIPINQSLVSNAHHYRLKIQIKNKEYGYAYYPVYLYNIERRFRVRGYSR